MPFVELFRSNSHAACEQRAFVLRAVGIASDVLMQDNAFVLFVQAELEAKARDQLSRYDAENNAVPEPPPAKPKLHAFAWLAPILYGLTLLVVAFFAGRSVAFDWYAAGSLTSSIAQTHEWWRAVTALTLHVDHDHLLRNLGFGAFFAYPAARLVGSGVAFTGMMISAIFGNALDSALMPHTHISIGASTIVFATLGLISAYSWRLQFSKRLRWAHRWAPLVLGVALLGLLGSGGENTDVLGHLTGFFSGAAFGVILARIPTRCFDKLWLQIASAATSVVLVVLSWTWAMLSYA